MQPQGIDGICDWITWTHRKMIGLIPISITVWGTKISQLQIVLVTKPPIWTTKFVTIMIIIIVIYKQKACGKLHWSWLEQWVDELCFMIGSQSIE